MATTLAPYGLRQINQLGAAPTGHGQKQYLIASGYTVPIFNGDPVIMLDTGADRGTIKRLNATSTTTTTTSSGKFVGVFVGVSYTDPTLGYKVWRQYYPGSIVASDIYAHVVDDPFALFAVQADGAVAQTKQFCNAALVQTAVGNTITGNSGLCLKASTMAETATLPVRIVGFSLKGGDTIGDTYTNVIVKINTHAHLDPTGTQAS